MDEYNKNRYGRLLPIGSVLKLKKLEKRVMVTGFLCMGQSDNDMAYDYSGCFFPEGILTGNKNIMFNQNQIEELCYPGYIDDEEKEYKENLSLLMDTLKIAIESV